MTEDVQKHSVHTLVFRSLKRTHDMFLSDQANVIGKDSTSDDLKKRCKVNDEYRLVKDVVQHEQKQKQQQQQQIAARDAVIGMYEDAGSWNGHPDPAAIRGTYPYPNAPGVQLSDGTMMQTDPSAAGVANMQLMLHEQSRGVPVGASIDDIRLNAGISERIDPSSNKALITIGNQQMLVPRRAVTMPKPQWHPPWKLYRVISGHLGWVRSVAVEPGNEWFVTGAGDRMVKIWDLATGTLKLSLTGHISSVRGVAVSKRQPYLFSCGEDKEVKCWDLEYNKVIRHYHGHLSAVYSIDLHPTIDVLVTCGRDGTARIWDMRTKACIHTLAGHSNTVAEVRCQDTDPQIVTCSHDCTVRLWDLAAGKSKVTLTNHKKSVRSIALHPTQFTFASGSPDNIKMWKFPDGNFIQNLSGHNAIINSMAVNSDSVMVSAADNGTLHFWDWKTGYNFQRIQALAQPGSIDSEAGIFACTFDQSGSRLITCEADKTIKIYKEDDSATEESHPINWRPNIMKKQRY